jgi:hypothetical protein
MQYQQLDPILLREHIDAARSKGVEAYKGYVDAATTGALTALSSGNGALFDQWKKSYPDLAAAEVGGFRLGDFKLVGATPNIVRMADGTEVKTGTQYTLQTPDGQPIVLDDRGVREFAAHVKGDPGFWAQAGQYGSQIQKDERQWATDVGTQQTNAANAQTNRLIALQQAREMRLRYEQAAAEALARAQGNTDAALQSTYNMLYKDGSEMAQKAVDGSFIPNTDGSFAPTGAGSAMTIQVVGADGKLEPAANADAVTQISKQGKANIIKTAHNMILASPRVEGGVVRILPAEQAAEYALADMRLQAQQQNGGVGVATIGDGTTLLRTPSPGGWLLWRGQLAPDGRFVVNSSPLVTDEEKFRAARQSGWLPQAPPPDYLLRASKPRGGMPAKPAPTNRATSSQGMRPMPPGMK